MSRPRSSGRSRPRPRPASTGCMASSRSPRPSCYLQAGQRCAADRPGRDRPRARWRPVCHRPRDEDGLSLSASRPRTPRSSSRTARRTGPARSPTRATSRSAARTCSSSTSKNVLWRWRPADDTGKGTLTKVTLAGAASLGDDIMGFNTYLRPGTRGLYNLYVVDPSEQQIRLYSPAADGSGFPARRPAGCWRLATSRR